MQDLALNVSLALVMGFYLLSFYFFDRLLSLEASGYPEQWSADGRPVGPFTLTRARRGNDIAAVVKFLRVYVTWNFNTPPWARKDRYATRLIWASRSVVFLTVAGLYVIRGTLM